MAVHFYRKRWCNNRSRPIPIARTRCRLKPVDLVSRRHLRITPLRGLRRKWRNGMCGRHNRMELRGRRQLRISQFNCIQSLRYRIHQLLRQWHELAGSRPTRRLRWKWVHGNFRMDMHCHRRPPRCLTNCRPTLSHRIRSQWKPMGYLYRHYEQ